MRWSAVVMLWVVAGAGVLPAQTGTPVAGGGDAKATAGAVGDAERSALTFTAYDLSVQLRPAEAGMAVAARVTVRNDGMVALPQIALQVSSSLHWDGISEARGGRVERLHVDQHAVETDADHTGSANEAVVRLGQPLAPQGTAELTLLYSGTVRRSTERLERVGTSTATAGMTDWDEIGAQETLLRGFGDVLWYPTASPQVFLSEGAGLLRAEGQQMLRQSGAAMRLRVSVEYTGEAPGMAVFCGRQELLVPVSDNADAPVAEAPGIATAEFRGETLGFRTPSLFVTEKPSISAEGAVASVSSDAGVADRLAAAVGPVLGMVREWFGSGPSQVVTVIDHAGAPFADGALLVAPVRGADAAALGSALVPALTHARFRSRQVWIDQGAAEFASLLWMERTESRAAAVSALAEQAHALALAESSVTAAAAAGRADRGLLEVSDPVRYRNKAAAVLWMLREMVGDDAMKRALQRYGHGGRTDEDGAGLERVLEEISGKDLRWFFEDWVYHDRGLPELGIVSVAARELTVKSASGGGGRLVVVEVKNDGDAAAEVPVTVSAGGLTATERLRIGAHASASTRILFQGVPEQVQVNDGTVPEMITSVHTAAVGGR